MRGHVKKDSACISHERGLAFCNVLEKVKYVSWNQSQLLGALELSRRCRTVEARQ